MRKHDENRYKLAFFDLFAIYWMSIQSYLQQQLNDEQLAAATYCDDHALILAGAGSWKTRTLTYKIAYLILEKHIGPDNILAVTFTNKAANEMKQRLKDIMRELQNQETQPSLTSPSQREKVSFDFDDLLSGAESSEHPKIPERNDYQRISTFHSSFLKILKRDITALNLGYTNFFSILDTQDSVSLIKQLLKQHRLDDRVEYQEAKSYISNRKSQWRTPTETAHNVQTQKEEWILSVYQHYQKSLIDTNATDFDDLLLLPKLLFTQHPDILTKRQRKFQYILVDEAQDTNTIQFELMRLLVGEKGNITFIGDDYQSIYGRRGAVMDNFLNVKQRWPSIKMFKLQTNYRSKGHIVDAGNAIIKHNHRQYDKTVVAHRQESDLIRVFTFQDEIDEAQQIVSLITKLKEEQNKSRSDFTILYRINALSSSFEQILLSEGIPYKVVGAFKFFERKEVKDVISYIRFLLNPKDSVSLQRIINTPNRQIGKTTIDQLHETAMQQQVSFADVIMKLPQYAQGISPAVQQKLQQFTTLLTSVAQLISALTPAQLLEQLVQSIGYKAFLIKENGEEKGLEKMENIGQLINMATKYDQPGKDSLLQFLEEISLMTSIEEASVDEADAIKLMSIHAAKGLEFPYVFIVGLEENIFPLPKAKIDENELEEERRGMYVAITRAKDHLFLSHAHSRQQRGQIKYNPPSRFIEELPPELLKRYDLGHASRKQAWPSFDEGDKIAHKLFGSGTVVELRGDVAIIRFDNPRFGVRKLECRFLHAA